MGLYLFNFFVRLFVRLKSVDPYSNKQRLVSVFFRIFVGLKFYQVTRGSSGRPYAVLEHHPCRM